MPSGVLNRVANFFGNKAKGRISKRKSQESKAHQIFKKTNILPSDTHT